MGCVAAVGGDNAPEVDSIVVICLTGSLMNDLAVVRRHRKHHTRRADIGAGQAESIHRIHHHQRGRTPHVDGEPSLLMTMEFG